MKTYAKVFSTLTVIMSVFVLCMIAYPKINGILENYKIGEYSKAQASIIDGAKDKYKNSTNNKNIVVYEVSELIKEGYMDKNEKNPMTGKKYKKTDKVLVINDNGKITIHYMNGKLLTDIIENQKETDGLYKENDEYIYKGENALNFISFNQEIFRIIKIDKEGYTYLIKNECDNEVNKSDIDNYLDSFSKENYDKNLEKIIKQDKVMLSYDIYQNSIIDNKTFITSKKDIWIIKDEQYKVFDIVNKEVTNETKACVKDIIKLKNGIIITSGKGSQLNPYIINM